MSGLGSFAMPILSRKRLAALFADQTPSGTIGGQVFTAEGAGAASFQFGETANILDMGIKADGITNDAPRLQVLFNAFRRSGIGLFLPARLRDGVTPARMKLSNVVNPVSYLRFIVDDSAVIDANIAGATTSDCPFVYLFGPLATGSTTVNGTAVMFSDRLPVASTAGIVPGQTWVAPFDGVNGIRGGIYKVIAIPAPGVLQLDRPILWPFSSATGDGVSIYNGVGPDGVTNNPALTDFSIESPGEAIFEGQCVAYMNIVGTENCGIRGLRARAGGSGTGIASDAGFAFQIGYRNWQRDLYIDGHGGNVSNKAIPLVAQEEFFSQRVTADEGGTAGTNFGIQDCVNCDFFHSISQGGLNGVVLATETAALSGIQSNRWVRMYGTSIVNATAEALALGVGASYNLFDGLFIARAAVLGISLNDGGNVTPVEQNTFVDYDVINCGAGIHAINHAIRNRFLSGRIVGTNAGTDLIIDSGAPDNSFDDLVVDNAIAAGPHIVVSADASFRNLTGIYTIPSSIGLEVAAAVTARVRDYKLTLPANSDAFYVPAGVLDVAHGSSGGSNAGTIGVQTNGGTARVGPCNDFSTLGAALTNSAGFMSRGVCVGGVAFPWPDLKVTDRVIVTPNAAAIPFGITENPGVGFTAIDATGAGFNFVIE
jgi:hypothetical protein